MIFKIKKGKHYSRPRQLWFSWKNVMSRRVTFSDSCKYEPDPENDTNKLFGFGFLWNHHKHSARFGWTYSPMIDAIMLHAYCYVDGVRVNEKICSISLNVPALLEIKHTVGGYWFRVEQNGHVEFKDIQAVHNKRFKYGLGFYFGGNAPAPHDMTIKIEKV